MWKAHRSPHASRIHAKMQEIAVRNGLQIGYEGVDRIRRINTSLFKCFYPQVGIKAEARLDESNMWIPVTIVNSSTNNRWFEVYDNVSQKLHKKVPIELIREASSNTKDKKKLFYTSGRKPSSGTVLNGTSTLSYDDGHFNTLADFAEICSTSGEDDLSTYSFYNDESDEYYSGFSEEDESFIRNEHSESDEFLNSEEDSLYSNGYTSSESSSEDSYTNNLYSNGYTSSESSSEDSYTVPFKPVSLGETLRLDLQRKTNYSSSIKATMERILARRLS